MDNLSLLCRLMILQFIIWVMCLPHLSMDNRGIELATSVSTLHINLLSTSSTSNETLFWIFGYGAVHSAAIQIFTQYLVKTTKPDYSSSVSPLSLPKAIEVLRKLSGEFPGLKKHTQLLLSMEEATSGQLGVSCTSVFSRYKLLTSD